MGSICGAASYLVSLASVVVVVAAGVPNDIREEAHGGFHDRDLRKRMRMYVFVSVFSAGCVIVMTR